MDLFSKLQKMKMLLIDDDEWIRDSLSFFFDAEGCKLRTFETAEEALKVLRRQHYDIIICDYRLPGMDGLQFFKHIQGSHPHAIKILITAYMTDGVAKAAKKLGTDELIAKPFTSEKIETSLTRLLGNA